MKTILKPCRQKGVAAIELAFVLPLMLILAFGITELGRALYQYNGLVKATRGAVRYLAQQDLANADLRAVHQNTRNIAVYGNEGGSGSPLVPGLSTSMVLVCDYVTCEATHKGALTGQGTVDLVTVQIGDLDKKAFSFKSMMSYVLKDFKFSPIQSTMASRYY